MKKTQLKDALRNIWKQKVSFLSIVVIAMLGVTIFLGIDYSADAIRKNGTAFYADTNFRDVEILSTLLFSEEDLQEIRRLDGVTDVEGVYVTSAKVSSDGVRTDANVISLTERISLPVVTEGRLPQSDRECAVEQRLMEQMRWKTGDVITVTNASDGKPEYLQKTEYEICGVIIHPDHVCNSIPETPYIVVTPDVFDTDALNGCFMKAEIMADRQADLIRYIDTYRAAVNPASEELEALAEVRTPLQEQSVKDHSNALLDETRQKLDDAEAELADGRKELDDGWDALRDGEKQYEEGKQQLEDARQQLDKTKQQLADAEKKLKDGRKELDDAKAQLDEGAAELAEGKKQLDSAKQQLVTGWNQIEDAKATIRSKLRAPIERVYGGSTDTLIHWSSKIAAQPDNASVHACDFWITDNCKVDLNRSLKKAIAALIDSAKIPNKILKAAFMYLGGEGEFDSDTARSLLKSYLIQNTEGYEGDYNALADACKKWDAGHRQYLVGLWDYRAALAKYNEGLAAYEEGEAQYAEGLKEYEDGLRQYNEGEAQYAKGVAELEQARKDLEEARSKLADGEVQYEDGLKQYNEGTEAFEEAKERIDTLGPCKWVVFDSYGNAGFVQLGTAADNLNSMEMTFALLFVIVGALVIYATVSKMVDEQRRQVGTTKALGFFNREIFAKYLLFGVSATLIGCILGLLLARFGIQSIVLNGYSMYFDLPLTRPSMVALSTVIVFTAGLLLAFFSILLACIKLLRSPAVKLMQQAVPQGRKKSASGKQAARSLYSRLILLNIRSDIRRVLVTVVSVAGCCALVVIGFTLRNSVQNTTVRQMNEVVHYDGTVLFDPAADAGTTERVEAVIKGAGAAACPMTRKNITVRIRDLDIQELYVGDLPEIGEMIGINDPKTGKQIAFTDDGILVSKRFSERYGLRVGDRIEIALNGTESATVSIAGIFNNFIGRSTYMSKGCFRKLFGKDAEPNAYLVRLDGAPLDPLLRTLETVKGYESYRSSDDFKAMFEAATSVMNMVVLLFIFMSAIMAGVVLMNLTNIYIMQKMRELTIMRINGFTTKEVIGYCARETVVTTAVGIVFGIVLGAGIGYKIVLSLEQSFVQFDRRVSVLACLIGVLMTAAFAVIVNVIALRKVKKLKLTDLS